MNKYNNSLVSVIIATYNSEKVLDRTLKALRAQTYYKYGIEIIIVDGMSCDKTCEIARKYNCIIINNPKIEQGNAKILGMQKATGKYILFVDSDEVLENSAAIEKTVKAFSDNKNCHYAVCSGYKKPEYYSKLSGYISDCGDPFSFFLYGCPKDYRFFGLYLKKKYCVDIETDDYAIFECDLTKKFLLVEGGCGGAMMDMEYFDSIIPNCRKSISDLYHSYYQMCAHGDTKVIYMKNNPLAHYSSDKLKGYFRKLKWRVCNNIHFHEKGEEVFTGREKYEKGKHFKKYLFIPYGISLVIPLLHSIPYAISRRNPIYLMHCIFSFYVVIQIICQYCLRLLHITPAFVAYGSDRIIKDKVE